MLSLTLSLVLLAPLECGRLKEICRYPTGGHTPPAWCSDGNLEEWCPLEGSGLTVWGETPPPLPPPPSLPPLPPSPQPPRKGPIDTLEVRCSPRTGLNGYVAQLFARIERPVKLYCPEITIKWPDGGNSGPRQSDCEPLAKGEEAESWSTSDLWPNGIRFEVYGRMRVMVEARAGTKTARDHCDVEGQ